MRNSGSGAYGKNDRSRPRRSCSARGGGDARGRSEGHDHVGLQAREIGQHGRHAVQYAAGLAILDRDVLPFDVALALEALEISRY